MQKECKARDIIVSWLGEGPIYLKTVQHKFWQITHCTWKNV